VGYTPEMVRIVRSAMLQTRVTPEIKHASEHVLHRLGLNMTEAIELFLRRMVIDQRLPFDVVAFDNATYTQLLLDWEEESHAIAMRHARPKSRMQSRSKQE
jgi:addiction module RelB/DinJ family antitoxin